MSAVPSYRLVTWTGLRDAAAWGEITGRVVSAHSREPIANAEVTWATPAGAALSLTTRTDGRFTLEPREAGTWQLASATADGGVRVWGGPSLASGR